MSSARLFSLLFSADSAKDRSVANLRRLAIFLQPFNHLAANQRIREMLRRPRCAPQFNRSLPCPLAIWLMRPANGVVAVVDTWRLSQSRKSSSTIANSEPLIGSMWLSLMIRSSPDLSASRTTAAALPLLALRRWRTSAMASPNDSNRFLPATLFGLLRFYASRCSGMLVVYYYNWSTQHHSLRTRS